MLLQIRVVEPALEQVEHDHGPLAVSGQDKGTPLVEEGQVVVERPMDVVRADAEIAVDGHVLVRVQVGEGHLAVVRREEIGGAGVHAGLGLEQSLDIGAQFLVEHVHVFRGGSGIDGRVHVEHVHRLVRAGGLGRPAYVFCIVRAGRNVAGRGIFGGPRIRREKDA